MLLVLLLGDVWIIVRGVSGRQPVKIDRIERFDFPGSGDAVPTEGTEGDAPESDDSETDNN